MDKHFRVTQYIQLHQVKKGGPSLIHSTCLSQFDVPHPRIEECCNHHDRCYDTCNNKRKQCDEQFNKCLNTFCATMDDHSVNSDQLKGGKCGKFVETMQLAVAGLGCPPYMESQRKSCLCDGKTLNTHQMNQVLKMKDELSNMNWKRTDIKEEL